MIHRLNDPTYNQVKLSVKADLHDVKGTFSFSMMHQVTNTHISVNDSSVTIGLNFNFPSNGKSN